MSDSRGCCVQRRAAGLRLLWCGAPRAVDAAQWAECPSGHQVPPGGSGRPRGHRAGGFPARGVSHDEPGAPTRVASARPCIGPASADGDGAGPAGLPARALDGRRPHAPAARGPALPLPAAAGGGHGVHGGPRAGAPRPCYAQPAAGYAAHHQGGRLRAGAAAPRRAGPLRHGRTPPHPLRLPHFRRCAPESLRHGAFSSASDVWMFGVTLWEMFSQGQEPWAGVPPYLILQRLEKDRARLPRPSLCSRALYALALRCWAPHPADRPGFSYLEGLLQEAWPPESRCMRDVAEPGALRMEPGDPITIIDGSPDSTTWKGQNGRTLKVGSFPASAVTLVDLGGSSATHSVHRDSPARGERLRGSLDGDRAKAKLQGLPPERGQRRTAPLQRTKGISKSLESVLSLGPRVTGGGSSPPELRHTRAVPQGPPTLPPHPPFVSSSSSQPSQLPRERPPWPKRESPHSHPIGKAGASKATVSPGGSLSDSELQRKILEVELCVHGVTYQECQAALRATGGDVVSAIQNLKVDQLFHLSSRSRADCRHILEHYQWDLSAASRYVLARP
ncbi:non-receptor tyrosine-protein kinase TNK1 isoform X3 [Tamandua tetradactyla]|uniref:non-receptor tyrosine-protein kinase TNK1 isoform X3 n=1 Tax=Tamandua tetradactyla TaxID=48850 RepID=UPI004053A8C5